MCAVGWKPGSPPRVICAVVEARRYRGMRSRETELGRLGLARFEDTVTQQHPATVLLVEDVADTREMYAEYLRHCGFAVVTATNGAEALDAARTRLPDLILMDAAMPGLDGWMATKLLKSDPATRNVPVLILTAHVFAEHRAKAQEVGADGFIAKPCMPDELSREVAAALQRWETTRSTDTAHDRKSRAGPAIEESHQRIVRGRKKLRE